ncbi:GumC family protein [Pseudovibrio exalbescens]|uniref:Sugar transporter n=1 Tax=Pseudovibrio exalbescens TaxID=197461 RepID=A0A1U7JFY0_9HYPH|nr:exopolysaccharide transport family protein [Pseudovibrio exalbescens]OKL43639.1 sugar transporter [Pseudovibrio exalbescens]
MPQEDVFLDMSILLKKVFGAMLWLVPLSAIVGLGALVAAQFLPVKYTSEARVLIDTANLVYPVRNGAGESERALLDNQGIISQVQLISSRDLARRVVNELNLTQSDAFLTQQQPSLVDRLRSMLGLAAGEETVSAEERALEKMIDGLDVYRVDQSRVISVSFTGKDPELAARIANAIVAEYRSLQDAAKKEANANAAEALAPQVERLRKDVEEAQQRVEEFRASADLLMGSENRTLTQQRMTELSSQVSEAMARRSEAEARADLIRGLLENGGDLETASEVLNSQLIQRLRERQVELQTRIAELSTTLLPNHPQVRSLRSQLGGYDRQIRAEAEKIMRGLENEAKVANQRVEDLNAALDELKAEAARSGSDQVRLQELERDAQAKAEQLNTMLASLREAEVLQSAGILNADARVISRATPPIERSGLKPWALGAILGFATLFLGCVFVIVRALVNGEVLRRELYTVPPVSSAEPVVAKGLEKTRPSETVVEALMRQREQETATDGQMDTVESLKDHQAPKSQEAAAAERQPGKAMENAVASAGGSVGRIVVLSVDSERLSNQIAFDCTRRIAKTGIMPLFLEVRSETPELQTEDETESATATAKPIEGPGFAELLAGSAAFTQVIHRDPISRAHVIPAGDTPIGDDVILGGRYNLIMEALDLTYDVIVADIGLIEPSLISAQMLAEADRVIVATDGSPAGPELEKALAVLEKHTDAPVEVERVTHGKPHGRLTADMAA